MDEGSSKQERSLEALTKRRGQVWWESHVCKCATEESWNQITIPLSKWVSANGKELRFSFYQKMEPFRFVFIVMYSYFVYRRSALNPLFHPYYINYGANKIEIYDRFRAMKCTPCIDGFIIDNSPFLLSKGFGFDIPHVETRISSQYSKNIKKQPMFIQRHAFQAMCQ